MDGFQNKRVTVAGLGHFGGGIAVSKWLVQQGAKVLVTDLAPTEKLRDSLQQLDGLLIEFHLGGHRIEDFTQADLVVTSPAIPFKNEFLSAARNAGVAITTEIRLFVERCPARIIGITGTKGKSTTTALLSLMLAGSRTVHTGGNIGRSLLLDLPNIKSTDAVVLELSSFMLEHLGAMKWSPHVALVNMVSIDHVDWHGSSDAYVNAKKNIVRFQTRDDMAIVSEENEASADFAKCTPAKILRYGLRDRKPFDLAIPGKHNQLNAQAAFTAAQVFDVSWEDAQRAIRSFPGLPHRLQLVHTSHDGVRWFNDSIATTPESAVAGLESFPRGCVIQIVGGSDKGLSMSGMCEALATRAKAVLTIGLLGPKLAAEIRDQPQVTASVYECKELAIALKKAREIASSNDVILLSTGCASYDQFENFQQRGDRFAALARGNANPS